MNKLKDIWRKDAKITIETLIEKNKEKDIILNKEKSILVKINKGDYTASALFPYTKKGKKQALDFINEELHWKSIVPKINIQKRNN